jgi:hypothetical protein
LDLGAFGNGDVQVTNLCFGFNVCLLVFGGGGGSVECECNGSIFSFVCFWRWWGVEVVMVEFGFGVAGVWFQWWLLVLWWGGGGGWWWLVVMRLRLMSRDWFSLTLDSLTVFQICWDLQHSFWVAEGFQICWDLQISMYLGWPLLRWRQLL